MSSHNVIEPTPETIEQSKESSRQLAKYHNAENVHPLISGSDGSQDDVILPGVVMQMRLDILSEFSSRNAIGVIPHKAQLSTQQAATS